MAINHLLKGVSSLSMSDINTKGNTKCDVFSISEGKHFPSQRFSSHGTNVITVTRLNFALSNKF